MQPPINAAPPCDDVRTDRAWRLALAAAANAERLAEIDELKAFALGPLGDASQLCPVPEGHPDAAIAWQPGTGWQSCLSSEDPNHALLELYLPICSATSAKPTGSARTCWRKV